LRGAFNYFALLFAGARRAARRTTRKTHDAQAPAPQRQPGRSDANPSSAFSTTLESYPPIIKRQDRAAAFRLFRSRTYPPCAPFLQDRDAAPVRYSNLRVKRNYRLTEAVAGEARRRVARRPIPAKTARGAGAMKKDRRIGLSYAYPYKRVASPSSKRPNCIKFPMERGGSPSYGEPKPAGRAALGLRPSGRRDAKFPRLRRQAEFHAATRRFGGRKNLSQFVAAFEFGRRERFDPSRATPPPTDHAISRSK